MNKAFDNGFKMRISDRLVWEKLKNKKSRESIIKNAEKLLKQPFPRTSDELYLDFSKTGVRENWEKINFGRRGWIGTLSLAECMENKGRFLPAIEETIREICKEKTWIMPAHDHKLDNFYGRIIDIDLGSGMLGLEMAICYHLLGERLKKSCQTLIKENINRRILFPFKNMTAGKQTKNWWFTCTNNWNSVCLACVAATAFIMIDSKKEQAFFISEALKYSKYYLDSFTDDGYCSEGLAYWNYGFGYYMLLAETILRATHGKVNLFKDKKTAAIAEFHSKIRIINDVYPAFSDCPTTTKPLMFLVKFISYRFGKTGEKFDNCNDFISDHGKFYSLLMSQPEKVKIPAHPAQNDENSELRTWFNNAGILICRPGKNSSCRIGAAFRGGNCGGNHNHNDIGSYVLVVGNETPVLDPGIGVYTARTFNAQRYESKLINSFGHPVPIVGGQLQKTGGGDFAKVLKMDFSDESDIYEMDISSAYPVKELQSLKRRFVYSRRGIGSLTITDEVSFSKPMDFETAVITAGFFSKNPDSSFVISAGSEKVLVKIATDGGEIKVVPEKIKEDTQDHIKPLRIGLRLKKMVTRASITLKFVPLAGYKPKLRNTQN